MIKGRIIFLNVLFIYLTICNDAFARKIYISSSQGNDLRNIGQASHLQTPWKTIAKLNASQTLLQPGDTILFKRGDSFQGTIELKISGTVTKPLVIAAYGNTSDPLPVIDGRITLKKWKPFSKGVWVSEKVAFVNAINSFAINHTWYGMGRYPNADAANGGYLILDSATGNTVIYDDALKQLPDFTGAEMAIKPHRWLIDRNPIIRQNGNAITYKSYTGYTPGKGFGYFIQNHLKTLDQFGEWYYDGVLKNLYLWLGKNDPSQLVIQAGRYNNLLKISGQANIKTTNVHFTGSNASAIVLENARNIEMQDCLITNCGLNGLEANGVSGLLFHNNSISDCNNTGFDLEQGYNFVFAIM